MEAVIMAERTQINFRIDNTLLAAIRKYCKDQDLSQTDFITHALKSALGISPTTYHEPSNDAIQELTNRIALLEQRLSKQLDNSDSNQLDDELETKLDSRIAEISNKLDERIGDAVSKRYKGISLQISNQIVQQVEEFASHQLEDQLSGRIAQQIDDSIDKRLATELDKRIDNRIEATTKSMLDIRIDEEIDNLGELVA